MAVEARSFGWQGLSERRRLLSTLGNLAGTAFLHSLENGEEVYRAMLARGFSGKLRFIRMPFKSRDVGLLLVGLALLFLNFALVR